MRPVDRIPSPKDLRGAAAVAQSLAYVVGLAGVVAGGLAFSDGDTAGAVIVWVLTFAAGALLMIVAFLTRGMAALLARIARMESDLAQLVADRGGTPEPGRDPWGRHTPPY
ncbi:MAG: hypothetical protein KY469_17310 [Actinobacteria bacterium]|nr:hypothetical protein [Actinomycetota bacterium]